MLVFSFHFLVRYLYTLSWSLYNVYKNPQCNWECCVGVILLAQNTRGANVTEEIGDQNMERNQVEGEDDEVCFIITFSIYTLNDLGNSSNLIGYSYLGL